MCSFLRVEKKKKTKNEAKINACTRLRKQQASLMVIYISTCPALFAVPFVIRRCGAVGTMMIGGLCYAVYIISLIYVYEPTVLLASVVVGFGQAAIWVSQGVVLTQSSDDRHRGEDAGLFWGIYSASGIVGPAFGAFFAARAKHALRLARKEKESGKNSRSFAGYVVYKGMNVRGFFLFASVCTLIGVFVFHYLHRHLPPKSSAATKIVLRPAEDLERVLASPSRSRACDDDAASEPLVGFFRRDDDGDERLVDVVVEESSGGFFRLRKGWTWQKVGLLARLSPLMRPTRRRGCEKEQ